MTERRGALPSRRLLSGLSRCCGLLLAASLQALSLALAQDLYPKPLLHTPTDHPASRVLLLNIEGMHALDLARWVDAHPSSALAELSQRGVTYTNAHTPWADPAAGLVSVVTGGSPRSTGILTVDGYDRTLSPPSSPCGLDHPSDGAATPLYPSTASSAPKQTMQSPPLDPHHGCVPLTPHQLLRVNTLFEIVHQRGGRTAWAGNNPALTDLLRGPSGQGLDEACDTDTHGAGKSNTLPLDLNQDAARVDTLLQWVNGKDCSGHPSTVPEIFGVTLTAFDAAVREGVSAYQTYSGQPSSTVNTALSATDDQIRRILVALKKEHLYDSTWIVVTSAFGDGAISPQRSHSVDAASLTAVADSSVPGVVLHIAAEGPAMLWLRDPAKTNEVVTALGRRADALGIATIATGAELALTMNPPTDDSRMPDIVLEPRESIRYTAGGLFGLSIDGGDREAETHVPVLISGAQFTGRIDKTWVPVTQVAPLLLRALGMDKFNLDALHHEHTPALPGIF